MHDEVELFPIEDYVLSKLGKSSAEINHLLFLYASLSTYCMQFQFLSIPYKFSFFHHFFE